MDCSPPDFSLSIEFSRQEYWSRLPLPSPGDLPDPGIEPQSPTLQADSLLSEPPGKPQNRKQLLFQMFCGTKAVTMTTRVTEIGVQYTRVGEGNGTPLQYSCLENPMDGGAWCAAVHGVARSRIRLSDFTFTFHFHALEKEMATHSSVLAWRIPGTGEPGGLPPMGSHRVGHDWCDLAAVAVFLVVLWFS